MPSWIIWECRRNKQCGQYYRKASRRLSDETKHISEVFQNLHTLAAIAEENSASSQEMSAMAVAEYSDKIKDLTSYVQQLEDVTKGFREELRKYVL